MKTRAHQRTRPPLRLWSGRIWPLLAGAVSAFGVFVAFEVLGVLAVIGIYATLAMFAGTVVWGLSLEFGLERALVVRWSLSSALAVVVALGLGQVHPQYGQLVGLVVALSSPVSMGLLAKARPRSAKRRPERPAPRTPGVLVDKVMLDRRFDEIVSQLKQSGDFPDR